MRLFDIGDRVEEIEELGLCKIVGIAISEGGIITSYQVRQFGHPHKIKWVDPFHITLPTERRHDPAYEHHHYEGGKD